MSYGYYALDVEWTQISIPNGTMIARPTNYIDGSRTSYAALFSDSRGV